MESYLEGLVALDPRREEDHRTYHDHLVAFNDALGFKVNGGLTKVLIGHNPKEDFYVATTGSDARAEKGTVSPVELILYVRGERPSDELQKRIEDFVWGPDASRGRADFDQYTEVKSLAKGNLNTTVFGANSQAPRKMVSPNRFMDSQIAYARNLRLNSDFWDEFVRRISDGEGREMIDEMKVKVKNHRRCTLEGTQVYGGERKVHYDLEDGVAFYNPAHGIYSFKQGPIRLVQFALARDKLSALREGLPQGVICSSLPANTVGQLNALQVLGLTELSPAEIRDLADSYKYFLWQYQVAQARSLERENTTPFDSAEVRRRLEDVARICSNGNGASGKSKPNKRIVRYQKKVISLPK